MGRGYRWQESHTKLRFLEMLSAGTVYICSFSLRPGYDELILARDSIRLCFIPGIYLNKLNMSRC